MVVIGEAKMFTHISQTCASVLDLKLAASHLISLNYTVAKINSEKHSYLKRTLLEVKISVQSLPVITIRVPGAWRSFTKLILCPSINLSNISTDPITNKIPHPNAP